MSVARVAATAWLPCDSHDLGNARAFPSRMLVNNGNSEIFESRKKSSVICAVMNVNLRLRDIERNRPLG